MSPEAGDSAAPNATQVEVDGRVLHLSNLNKVLWPQAKFTKRQMIAYYAGVAPALLPHLADRPITLKRYPDGIDGWYWFQTQCPNHPSWVRTEAIPSALTPGKTYDYCVIDDLASLIWTANLAAIELHPMLWRVESRDQPLVVVFDLDPGPPANITECCRVALTLRRVLGDLGLDSLPKTSGSKGLHVYVPLNTSHDHDETKAFARGVARILASDHPDIVVDRPQRGLRSGRVLVDWSQNDASKSIVAPYSLRGGAIPIASTPLSWSEVEAAVRRDDASTLVFSADRVLDRLDSVGDLFRPVLETRQTLSS